MVPNALPGEMFLLQNLLQLPICECRPSGRRYPALSMISLELFLCSQLRLLHTKQWCSPTRSTAGFESLFEAYHVCCQTTTMRNMKISFEK
jgi:hypothetical protein